MKKTIAALLTVMLLAGGITLFAGPERPRPEIVKAPVFFQA
ncbi:hypothetical protein ACPWSR_05570 [Alloiococcus sp. CFN-8]